MVKSKKTLVRKKSDLQNSRRKKAKESVDDESPVVCICRSTKDGTYDEDIEDIHLAYDEELLSKFVYPMSTKDFLGRIFRKRALHISNGLPEHSMKWMDEIVNDGLFGLEVQSILKETSSDQVFVWICTNDTKDATSSSKSDINPAMKNRYVQSIDVDDPDHAYTLYRAGHATYCRAPPTVEQPLVASMLRGTGLGCGHYDPSGTKGSTLGRGEVEVFIGTKSHRTNWHTDFQENFTLQLSGKKKWRLKQGSVKHPLRGCTPHYLSPDSVESQLKAARLSNPDFQFGWPNGSDMKNSYGEEQEVIMNPGDMLYFPAGMWHSVETIEEGISINISLMSVNYASLVSSAIHHILIKKEAWRQSVVDNSGLCGPNNATETLDLLIQQLPQLIQSFVDENGSNSILPPFLRRPPAFTQVQDIESLDGSEIESIDKLPRNKTNEKPDHIKLIEMTGDNSDQDSNSSDRSITKSRESSRYNDGSDDLLFEIQTFEVPSSYSMDPISDSSRFKKSPLAAMVKVDDIHSFYADNSPKSDLLHKEAYVLNVGYGGNESLESSVRVIFIDRLKVLADIYRREMSGELDSFVGLSVQENILKVLLYFGYLVSERK